MLKLAVFVSGRGSNFRAVASEIDKGAINAKIQAVISDKLECPAFEFASQTQIKTYSVSKFDKEGFVTYNKLLSILNELGVELIILAGFLKKIPGELIDNFENRIINIHPALLPSPFGGKGMYGLNVHKAVFDSSAKVTGATVHFVNKIYDDGKIIAQKCVDITEVKSPDEIAGKVLKAEHELLPLVVKKFSENKIKIIENRVVIE